MSALNPTARDLAKALTRMDDRIAALEKGARTSQLQHASLTGTAITVYDEDGTTRRGAIGIQPDGTIGLVAVGGPPPGAPTAPVVTPSLGGLSVVWDGGLDDGSTLPADFDHVAVHVSTDDGFTPSAATFAGTITRAGDGGRLPVVPLPYQEHYVRLLGVNTSGIAGAASDQTAGTPLQVDGPDLTAGSVTAGAIAAGAVTADKLAAIIALVTRLVAGDPAGARVELNEDGLRVYNSSGTQTVRFDGATGDAVFTGDITGSSITGSTINGGTITGGLIQTANTGAAIVLNQDGNNSIQVYDDDNNVSIEIGSGPPAVITSYTRGLGLSARMEGGRLYLGNNDETEGTPGFITAESDSTVHIEGSTLPGSISTPRLRFLPGNGTGTLEVSAAVGTVGMTVSGQAVPVPQPPVAPNYSAWTGPALTSYQALRLISDGRRVFLDGCASTATAFSGSQTAFTVPAAMRPKADQYFGLIRATSGDPRTIGCQIKSTGTVTIFATTNVATNDTWSFSEVSWSLD